MRVLFLSRLFFPHLGGVETHVREISNQLKTRGYEVTVITERLPKTPSSEIINGLRILRFRYPKISIACFSLLLKIKFIGLLVIWFWFLQNWQLIAKSDLVHIHDVFVWYLPFRFIFPKKPVFITFHGYETRFPPSKRAILVRKISEKLAWGNICVGDYIRKWYGTKPNYVVYGGVNINKAQNSRLRQGFGGQAKLKILFIGRLEEDTGVPIYLKTLGILKKRGVNFQFEACGDGPLRKKVEEWGQVYGFVPSLMPYLRGSDLVFTSSYLSILQALVARRLVFSTYNNPLKGDYLKMSPLASFIIIENNVKKLTKTMEYFFNHPQKQKEMVNKGYEWVEKQTWNKVGDLYIRLWRTNV